MSGAPQENVGLRKIGLRRSPTAPDTWDIFVAVRNYGTKPHAVDLELQFGKSPVGSQRLHARPGAEQQATFSYRTKVGGLSGGAAQRQRRVSAGRPRRDRVARARRRCTSSSIPKSRNCCAPCSPPIRRWTPSLKIRRKYDPAVKADVVVLDRFAPAATPRANSIWIEPPASGSPIPVRETRNERTAGEVATGTPLGRGPAHAGCDAGIGRSFRPGCGRHHRGRVGGGAAGGSASRSQSGAKLVALGFHPGRASMKYQTRHAAADRQHPAVDGAGSLPAAGMCRRARWAQSTFPSEKDTNPATVHVLDENQRPLPFTISTAIPCSSFQERRARCACCAAIARPLYSLTLPDVAEAVWHPPATVRRGIPRPRSKRLRRRICGRGWRRWAAWDCCSIGCSTDAAACSESVRPVS